jgi:uncharacterized membrane-anchored protein YhcB (DUF1043 family)
MRQKGILMLDLIILILGAIGFFLLYKNIKEFRKFLKEFDDNQNRINQQKKEKTNANN